MIHSRLLFLSEKKQSNCNLYIEALNGKSSGKFISVYIDGKSGWYGKPTAQRQLIGIYPSGVSFQLHMFIDYWTPTTEYWTLDYRINNSSVYSINGVRTSPSYIISEDTIISCYSYYKS